MRQYYGADELKLNAKLWGWRTSLVWLISRSACTRPAAWA